MNETFFLPWPYKLTAKELIDYEETVSHVYRLARTWFTDLLDNNKFGIRLAALSPEEFFAFVRSQEYVKDPDRIEFLNRPRISIALAGTGHPFDCDDRTILSLSYFMLQNYMNKIFGKPRLYDYRVLVVGRFADPHHIYIEYKKTDSIKWIPFDPTYPHNEYGVAPFVPGFIRYFYD
ncbi:hypothetical protein [Leptospira ilyithenensis]|uniref:Transglutaminase domain-containing protein n=1 Tax=Leptospira ilyithenensis TaxID=2484901 RepID=A0A4R9LMI5_9LEPT|nr:hypothetical protein [Leptospira ilyithenensis]TGN09772.1 hypothetical protein EHS11_11865 [Leptospira ilyithenensis]